MPLASRSDILALLQRHISERPVPEALANIVLEVQNKAYLEGATNAYTGLRGTMKKLEIAKTIVAATYQHLGQSLAIHEAADLAMLFLGLNKPEGDPNAD